MLFHPVFILFLNLSLSCSIQLLVHFLNLSLTCSIQLLIHFLNLSLPCSIQLLIHFLNHFLSSVIWLLIHFLNLSLPCSIQLQIHFLNLSMPCSIQLLIIPFLNLSQSCSICLLIYFLNPSPSCSSIILMHFPNNFLLLFTTNLEFTTSQPLLYPISQPPGPAQHISVISESFILAKNCALISLGPSPPPSNPEFIGYRDCISIRCTAQIP